jgi:MFS family permease
MTVIGIDARREDIGYDYPGSGARASLVAPWLPVALCAMAMLAEGFDAYSIGYAAPLLIKQWGVSPALLGSLFAASVVASAAGTIAIGPVADRWRRKPCLVLALLVFGLMTLATGRVSSFPELLAARILSGLALGASVPVAVALGSEAVRPTLRAAIAAAMSGFIAVGLVASSLTAALLVPRYGWPSLMYVGGLFAILLVPAILFAVREPAKGTEGEQAQTARQRVAGLFSPRHRWATLTCLFVLTMIFSVSFFLNFWLPTLLLKVHPQMRDVALAIALAQTTSVFGAFGSGYAMDRLGLKALAGATLLAGIALALAAIFGSGFLALAIGFCGACFFINGAFGGAVASPVKLFPPEMRATALGFSIGAGRLIGGSLGPMAGGWLLAHDVPPATVALSFVPPLLLASLWLTVFLRAGGVDGRA